MARVREIVIDACVGLASWKMTISSENSFMTVDTTPV